MMTSDEPQADEPRRRARRDEYLWSRKGPPDAGVAALEGALAQHRWRGELGDLRGPDAAAGEVSDAAAGPAPGAHSVLRRLPRALAAGLVCVALLAVGLSVWHGVAEPGGGPADADAPYRLQVLDGAPSVDGTGVAPGGERAMHPGASVTTDAVSRARLHVGEIGSVVLGPDSRLRLDAPSAEQAPDAGYLLHLDRGTLTASIFAAPRLFQLGTPSGIAVDMGCIYTAQVDAAGTTRLHVDMGQVSFETEGRAVLVPSGAATRAWPGVGAGTPVWDDAPEDYRAAVERYDEAALLDKDPARREAELSALLATDRPRDSLTLWHVLAHAEPADRAAAYERLAALEPPPEGVTREGCLAGARQDLLRWRDALGWAWATGTQSKLGR